MSQSNSQNTPSLLATIFSKALFFKIVRWSFVWLIALLPFAFVFYKQYIVYGEIDMNKLCSTGELFIVSIVMVTEPLVDLVTNKAKNSISIIFALFIIFVLVSSVYFFGIIEMNEERIRTCNGEVTIELLDCDRVHCDSLSQKSNNIENIPLKHGDHHISNEEPDNFVLRIKNVSKMTILWAFLIGMLSVIHSHVLKERSRTH